MIIWGLGVIALIALFFYGRFVLLTYRDGKRSMDAWRSQMEATALEFDATEQEIREKADQLMTSILDTIHFGRVKGTLTENDIRILQEFYGSLWILYFGEEE